MENARNMSHYKSYIVQLEYAIRHADSMEYKMQLYHDLTVARRQLKKIEDRVLVKTLE